MAHRVVRVRGGSKRATEWFAAPAVSAFTSLAAATALIDTAFVFGDPVTVVRAVGMLVAQSDQVAGDEEPFGAIGLAVVTDQAFAIGVTAVPTPYTDGGSDAWFMHSYWATPVRAPTAVGVNKVSSIYRFDSRAMRKVHADQTVILMMENGSSTHGVTFMYECRLLVKVS